MSDHLYLIGSGLWSPNRQSVAAWVNEGPPTSEPEETVRPRCAVIGGRLKRGSSILTQMLGEVVEQACSAASVAPADVATVYASSLGEIETMVILLGMLFEEEGKLSPNRFKNSVHNAASGLVSISTGSTHFSTAIAAGDRTFEMGLLESCAWVRANQQPLVYAVGDDRAPEPLRRQVDFPPLAVALCISPSPVAGRRWLRFAGPTPARSQNPPQSMQGWLANPAAPAVELVMALESGRRGPVSVGPPGRAGSQLVLLEAGGADSAAE